MLGRLKRTSIIILSLASTLIVWGSIDHLPIIGSSASALSGSDFNSGRIIDYGVFTNSDSMTANQIQSFLNAEMPDCDTNGAESLSYYYNSSTGEVNNSNTGTLVETTRAVYGQRYATWYNANPFSGYVTNESLAPYVCLNSYVENPTTGANNLQDPTANISGGESSAQIIYNAAQQYGINPQVILVTLQKEQGLITDDWPWLNEYQEAMGYNCPDGSGCSGYSSFYQQVNAAAAQYRDYLNNPDNYNYVVGNDTIEYNSPDYGCNSSSVVSVQNQATAALYDYTPYQPDSNVLNNTNSTGSSNGPGSTSDDVCAAYGNRNFWWYYVTWFGTTYANLYQAAIISQSAYPSVIPGQSQQISIEVQNVGQWTWHDAAETWEGTPPIILAANGPSMFSYGWVAPNVPAIDFTSVYEGDGVTLAPDQHEATPGEIVKYTFNVTPPWNAQPGSYQMQFVPVLYGNQVDFGGLATSVMGVNIPPNYQANVIQQSAYPQLSPGQSQQVSIEFQNTGQWTWHDTDETWEGTPPTILAATSSSMFSYGWAAPNVPLKTFSSVYDSNGTTLAPDQHEVAPGQIAVYTFNITAPWNVQAGSYPIQFVPVLNGTVTSFGSSSYSLMYANVPMWLASEVTQSSYPSLSPGQGQQVFIKYQNIGAGTWTDSTVAGSSYPAVELASVASLTSNTLQASPFSYGWPSSTLPTTTFGKVYESDGVTLASNQHEATFGQIVEFDFNLTAPWAINSGSYPQYFIPYLAGTSTSFGNNITAQINANVN